MLRTLSVVAALLAVAPPGIASAQAQPRSAGGFCVRAAPAPDCSVFVLTNAGGYLKTKRYDHSSPWRAIIDWGVMVNVGRRAAIGGSWFLSLDNDESLSTGPALRYRRWFGHARSLDLAVGTPIASDEHVQAGSIFALVKYNPVSWFGVAVRPEYLRHMVSAPVGYPDVTEGSGRISAGVEVGERTGAVLSIGAVVVVGLVVLLFEASGGFN